MKYSHDDRRGNAKISVIVTNNILRQSKFATAFPLFSYTEGIMKKLYKLLDVVHSGRKGIRGTTVCDMKYEGLIGYTCSFDIDDIQQFKQMKFDVVDSQYYDWWKTSEVLEVGINEEGLIVVETANTIYKFLEIKNEN